MKPSSQEPVPRGVHLVIPNIQFVDEYSLQIDECTFSADPSSRQARVLEFFCISPSSFLKREDLLSCIYEKEISRGLLTVHLQARMWNCGYQVLSRLRKALAQHFANKVPAGTEWLAFSDHLDGWLLYKLPGYGSDGGWHS